MKNDTVMVRMESKTKKKLNLLKVNIDAKNVTEVIEYLLSKVGTDAKS